jgi:thiamine-monophosphate kinase
MTVLTRERMSQSRPTEDEIIATYFAPLAGPAGLGLMDDVAAFAPPAGQDLVVTKDMLCAGVHFFDDDPPGAIARKALRVNLSDLAAKGAAPFGFLLGLALPNDWTPDWLAAFTKGLGEDAAAYRCPLMGGDTVRSPAALMLSITALGTVPAGARLPRASAMENDFLYVSGTIGDAALGLRLRGLPAPAWGAVLGADSQGFLRERYLLPQPRLGLRGALRDCAHAAMDVSDGLAGDLAKMLRASGLTAEIGVADVPRSPAAREVSREEPGLLETLLTGGDDYEVLAAVPPERAKAFERAAAAAEIPVCRIGTARRGTNPPTFRDAAGGALALKSLSYSHF